MIRYLLLLRSFAIAPCFVIHSNQLWHWTHGAGWEPVDRQLERSFNPSGIRRSSLLECTLIGGCDEFV